MTDTGHDLTRLRIERANARGARSRVWSWALGLALLLAAAGWWKFGHVADSRPAVRIARIETSGQAAAASGTAANGYVVARRRAARSTDMQGRIVELLVEEGDVVEEGQLIARLDSRQLDATLSRTHAELIRAQALAEFAVREFERLGKLEYPMDVSQSRLDQSKAEKGRTEADVEALRAAVREIEVMIDKSSIYAPFAGVIVEKNAEVGEVVSAIGATGPQSRGAVATLVDFATLEVQIELAQTSLKAAREGAGVRIYLDAYPEHAYRGRIRQIWPTANRSKATVELRAEFLERDDRILPEMGVRVVFIDDAASVGQDAPTKVWLPPAGLVDGAVPFVFVVASGGRVSLRPVTVGGPGPDGRIEILEGLSGNELVVLDPPEDLVDGDEVRPAANDG